MATNQNGNNQNQGNSGGNEGRVGANKQSDKDSGSKQTADKGNMNKPADEVSDDEKGSKSTPPN